ncbi:hypothetical protein JCM19232_2107 [Vibrio ishigakensis]|uniref:Uncharacterized protein n=1 Tax=Vibrio ishigakensis TaxID=1481914 RepID=A0A0B8PKK0_9VIBR|nr:hypothetical protein JCM19232_2107 [Vibrio ishigakensis]
MIISVEAIPLSTFFGSENRHFSQTAGIKKGIQIGCLFAI